MFYVTNDVNIKYDNLTMNNKSLVYEADYLWTR